MFGIRYREQMLQKFMYLMAKKLKGNNLNNTIDVDPAVPIKVNEDSIALSINGTVFELLTLL
jgi:hypothetical protein